MSCLWFYILLYVWLMMQIVYFSHLIIKRQNYTKEKLSKIYFHSVVNQTLEWEWKAFPDLYSNVVPNVRMELWKPFHSSMDKEINWIPIPALTFRSTKRVLNIFWVGNGLGIHINRLTVTVLYVLWPFFSKYILMYRHLPRSCSGGGVEFCTCKFVLDCSLCI